MSKQVVTLRVYRFDPGASAPPHYDEFQIPYSKGLTVLDGLIYTYENLDSSLSFRWSCKNVQCGTCGMFVNGEAVLACERKLELGETVQVDPFPLPAIKDVVTDFSAVEDKTVRGTRPHRTVVTGRVGLAGDWARQRLLHPAGVKRRKGTGGIPAWLGIRRRRAGDLVHAMLARHIALRHRLFSRTCEARPLRRSGSNSAK